MGFKLFLGGDSMRMGSYGVLDPMTTAMRVPVDALRGQKPGPSGCTTPSRDDVQATRAWGGARTGS